MGKEKKDKKHCRDDHFDCLDHKKCKKKCDCKKDKCQCKVKQFVKDCLCCEWTVPQGSNQTVFQTGGFKRIFGSGFISYDCGSADFIMVTFYLEGHQVGSPITVFEDSCVTFTFTKFDRIVVSCSPKHGASHKDKHKDHHNGDACEGEICITTRYPVK